MAEDKKTIEIAEDAYTPALLKEWLLNLVRAGNTDSVMIWGPPGIGKSAVVSRVAEDMFGLKTGFQDIRISQLAPTDLRGLPVPDKEAKTARWFAPEFLPRSGRGILFLDEINMAPPVVMGIAQQLVLDRRVGSYTVPPGWFIWAAGNRKEDKATVFDMSAPLANRFLHVTAKVDLDSFVAYAYEKSIDVRIIAFVQRFPSLLHKIDQKNPAWPSPRSWFMANRLLVEAKNKNRASLPSIAPAVGAGAENEFHKFLDEWSEQAKAAEAVVLGRGGDAPSKEGDVFSIMGHIVEDCLASFAKDGSMERTVQAFEWISGQDPRSQSREVIAKNLVTAFHSLGKQGAMISAVERSPKASKVLSSDASLKAMLGGRK